jgi:hypothetical protein
MAFDVIELANFGRNASDSFQIAAGGGLTSVEIDPSSELDACWIQAPTATTKGGLLGVAPKNSYGSNSGMNSIPPGSSFLLSMEHPAIGPIPGTITILPYYRFDAGQAINSAGDDGPGKLALRVWRTMPAHAIGTTQRAVLHAGWHSGGSNLRLIVPTFGRRFLRLFAKATLAATPLHVDYGWATEAGQCTFGTASDIVIPASPSFASFFTSDLPDWMTFYSGAVAVSDLVVEVYD